jgi:hypothetical protein
MPLALLALSGCGSDELNSPTAARLRGLANVYLDYIVPRNGNGPAREQDLKKHMRGLPDFVLQNSGIDPKDLDATFRSLRDEQPFVVQYGVMIGGISGNSKQVIAHEKTGKYGKLLVVFASGKVDLVTQDRLEKLLKPEQ